MIKHAGFTLIEMLLLIVVVGLLGNTILLTLVPASQGTPLLINGTVAAQTATRCMEWFSGQRLLNGYDSVPCPSSSVPSFCSVPSGYTISVDVACTTLNSDAAYKTVTVTVGGNGSATLSTLLADY